MGKSLKVSTEHSLIVDKCIGNSSPPPYIYSNSDHLQYMKNIILEGSSICTSAFLNQHVMYAFIVPIDTDSGAIIIKFGYSHDINDRTKTLSDHYHVKLHLVGLRFVTCESDEFKFHTHLKFKFGHLIEKYSTVSNGKVVNDTELYKLNPALMNEFHNFMSDYHFMMCNKLHIHTDSSKSHTFPQSRNNNINHISLSKQRIINTNFIRNLSLPELNMVTDNNLYSQAGLENAKHIWNSVNNMGIKIRMHKIGVIDDNEHHFFLDKIYLGMSDLIKYDSEFKNDANAMCIFTGRLHGGYIGININFGADKFIDANTVYLMTLLCHNVLNDTLTCRTPNGGFHYVYKLSDQMKNLMFGSFRLKFFGIDIDVVYNADRFVIHGSYLCNNLQYSYDITNLVKPMILPNVIYQEIFKYIYPTPCSDISNFSNDKSLLLNFIMTKNYDDMYIADLFYELYPSDYIYDPAAKNWYSINDHGIYINHGKDGLFLRSKIRDNLRNHVMDHLGTINDRITGADYDSFINGFCKKIGSDKHRKTIVEELTEKYFISNFDQSVNNNKYVFAFNNGVFDLKSYSFRDALPSELVTETCGYDYVKSSIDHVNEIKNIISSIFVDDDLITYVLKVMALRLVNINLSDEFYFFIGNDINGMNIFVSLIKNTFGVFAQTLDSDLSKDKMPKSHNQSIDNSHIVFIDDLNKPLKIKGNVIRYCSNSNSQFLKGKPTGYALFFISESTPTINRSDQNILRKCRFIPLRVKFVDNPDPGNKYQCKIDRSLNGKIEDSSYKCAFFDLIVDYYRDFVANDNDRLTPPLCVYSVNSVNSVNSCENLHSLFVYIKKTFIVRNVDLDTTFTQFYKDYSTYLFRNNLQPVSKICVSRILSNNKLDIVHGNANVRNIKYSASHLYNLFKSKNWLHHTDDIDHAVYN